MAPSLTFTHGLLHDRVYEVGFTPPRFCCGKDPDLIAKNEDFTVGRAFGVCVSAFPLNSTILFGNLREFGVDMLKMNCHHPPWWLNW